MAVQSRTEALHALGRSLWLDYMRRGILDKAIGESKDYDAALRLRNRFGGHAMKFEGKQ